jgi:phosphonopyruvate decarboxylase
VVNCENLDAYLSKGGVEFFTGVPDSCFVPWINFLTHNRNRDHVISTNEGEALSIAAGYNLATGRVAGVYLQNSGLGNLINPLTSIADKYVYQIPILLMISWRGKPGRPDEPQHKRMGENTTRLLELIDIKYGVYEKGHEQTLFNEMEDVLSKHDSYALIFGKGDIDPYPVKQVAKKESKEEDSPGLTRWDAIVSIAKFFDRGTIFFSTTGKISRELYHWRDLSGGDHSLDFLNVGGMGWVSSIALGFSLRSKKRVVILDGDGSLLMHMGNMATIGHYKSPNIVHFVLDNRSHESIGGLSTVSNTVNFAKIAAAVGYRSSATVSSEDELQNELTRLSDNPGPSLISIRVKMGSKPGLPRPSLTPDQRKQLLLKRLATT